MLCTDDYWKKIAALRQKNIATNEQKVHARQVGNLQDEFAKLASKFNIETLRANAAERYIAGLLRGAPKSGMLIKRGMAVAVVYKELARTAADPEVASLQTYFGALCASTRAQYAAAASNRPGTCAGWLSGLRLVWQMLCALGGGTRRRSRTKNE